MNKSIISGVSAGISVLCAMALIAFRHEIVSALDSYMLLRIISAVAAAVIIAGALGNFTRSSGASPGAS
jgi:lipoprotein signal peptidase